MKEEEFEEEEYQRSLKKARELQKEPYTPDPSMIELKEIKRELSMLSQEELRKELQQTRERHPEFTFIKGEILDELRQKYPGASIAKLAEMAKEIQIKRIKAKASSTISKK